MNDGHPPDLHLLHVFPTFTAGGTQLRMAAIMNGLGGRVRHTVMALDGNTEAARVLLPEIPFQTMPPPPGKGGLLYPVALRKVVRAAAPDLLLTYNWGAIDAALGAGAVPLCPVIHNECGFNADEAAALKLRRVLVRRFILNRIYATVVVSRRLLDIAREQFKLRTEKVRWIRTGVDVDKFQPGREAGWRSRMGLPEEALVCGYLGGLRPEKRLDLMLQAFAQAGLSGARLVLIGEGGCRRDLQELAKTLGIADQVVFAGQAQDPRPWLRNLDVFLMSSATEQMPNALLEAMASGLPAVCTDVGDCAAILDASGPPVIVPPGDLAAYVEALRVLAGSPGLRRELATANRRRCISHYSSQRMIREYADLYYAAAGRSAETAS
jgi:glycosyltransferase involved in cell wall biosynthesis